jgi:methylglutaconyl-CoA hydratase
MSGYVRSETHKGITSIEFFHPQSNSLPAKVLHDLAVAIQHAGHDPATIVIIFVPQEKRLFAPVLRLMNWWK